MRSTRIVLIASLLGSFVLVRGQTDPNRGLPKLPEPIQAVPVQVFNKGTKLHVRATAFSPDGKILYIAGTTVQPSGGNEPVDGRLGSWDVASGKLVREHKGPRMGYFWDGLCDGKYFLGRTESNRHLILLDPVTGEEVRRTQENTVGFDRYWILPDRKRILAVNADLPRRTGLEPVRAWEWDLVAGKRGNEIPLDLGDGFSDSEIVGSPDGAWFSQSDTKMGVRVFGAIGGKKVLSDPLGRFGTFAPDSKTFAYVAGTESRVRIHRTDTWQLQAEFRWPMEAPQEKAPTSRWVWAVHFTADGRALVIASDDSRIAVVEVATGQIRYHFAHMTYSLRIFPENPLLATVSGRDQGDFPSRTVALWDLHNPTGRKAGGLSDAEARRHLQQLDEVRSAVASEGMLALAANPDQAIPLLRRSLHAAPKPDPDQIARWIAELDSDDFDTREKADQKLRTGRGDHPSVGSGSSPTTLAGCREAVACPAGGFE